MKKLLFFVFLSGIGFKLKAQQNPATKPLDQSQFSNYFSLLDTIPRIFNQPKNNVNALFLPKQNIVSNKNLIASLDRMPIVKPIGKWNMPVVHPNRTVVYTTPVKRLPPVIKPDSSVLTPRP